MIGRVIEILLALGLFWLILHLLRGRAPAHRAPSGTGAREIRMVRCAHCGVHVPEPEAVRTQGHTYCSMDHGRLGPRGW